MLEYRPLVWRAVSRKLPFDILAFTEVLAYQTPSLNFLGNPTPPCICFDTVAAAVLKGLWRLASIVLNMR